MLLKNNLLRATTTNFTQRCQQLAKENNIHIPTLKEIKNT